MELLEGLAAAQRFKDVDRVADLSDGVRQGCAGWRCQRLAAANRARRVELHARREIRDIMNVVVLESAQTCPYCGFAAQETLPTDACQFFYECRNCKTLRRPKPGGRCVFCSFGSVKCPPVQEQHGRCWSN
jgi:hypothetical protein